MIEDVTSRTTHRLQFVTRKLPGIQKTAMSFCIPTTCTKSMHTPCSRHRVPGKSCTTPHSSREGHPLTITKCKGCRQNGMHAPPSPNGRRAREDLREIHVSTRNHNQHPEPTSVPERCPMYEVYLQYDTAPRFIHIVYESRCQELLHFARN